MVQKPKAVTYKVIAGYLLLIIIAAGAGFFIYEEIIELSRPHDAGKDNERLLEASNAIASLYASEAIAREYMLSGSPVDKRRYAKAVDSVYRQINSLKEDADPRLAATLDTIQLLLHRKENSIKDILAYRATAAWENTFRKAASEVHNVKDSIREMAPPVRAEKKNQYNRLLETFLSQRQLDSLSKLPVSNDSLTLAFSQAFNKLMMKDNRMRLRLYQKEQKMLEENRVISDQLRAILSSMEKEFLQNTYRQLRQNQLSVEKTFNSIAWLGAGGMLLIILLMWVIVRDLSINQQYRRRLEVLNEENQSLLKAKSILMATVTHDLQTPLGSILGFNNLLQNTGVNAKQQQYLDNVKQSAEYILKLVNDLLDFSKIENNRLSIEKSSTDLKQLIENTCRNLQPLAEAKGIELSWDVDDDLDAGYNTDPYRLRQVLTNIISNAVKFTGEGTVEVTAKPEGSYIAIAILDTGIGIAPGKQAEVFKEFTQAHTSIEKTYGGTGLGLTISKKIIEMLGGTIQLESEEGQGSIFTITIPAEKAPAAPPALSDKEVPSQLSRKYTILVIDDDATQLSLMRELLSAEGIEVITEANPGNVTGILEKIEADLILSDVQMPVMDGFMLLHKIRQHPVPAVKEVPVIALSGRRDLDPEYYRNMGFSACHPKPVRPPELLQLIQDVLTKRINQEDNASPTPVAQTPATALYNLESLSRFTHDDRDSLKVILKTFIASAEENCNALKVAANDQDDDKLAEIAHKMIPMLRQMEVHSIADMLASVEDYELGDDWNKNQQYIDSICNRMALLCDELLREVAA